MFTGTIEQVGKVIKLEERRGQKKLLVKTNWDDVKAGENISVNGLCLTAIECTTKGEVEFLVPENRIEGTNLYKLEANTRLNLERALMLSSRMGGHWVQGNIDTQGLVLNISEANDHYKIALALDPKYGRYCVEKGSIAINGVSLNIETILETKLNEFMITLLLVPQIWKSTNFSDLHSNDSVNVEVDILAKYVERLSTGIYTKN